VTPVQCRMARAATVLSMIDLSKKAGVSTNTLLRFERGDPLQERTVAAIRSAFEAEGIVFTKGDEPGVKLRKGKP
jgi:transcriptional regulator with XRE-family HTH domain